MYRGYQIMDGPSSPWNTQEYLIRGQKIFDNTIIKSKPELQQYINEKSVLDAAILQRDWFPQICADIFISHHHPDTDKAIALAGWLNKKFGLTAFVDSCVWKHSRELLRAIDNTYCKKTGDENYDYDKRNISTSQVHMIVCSALMSMINKCECMFFLNTPNAIKMSSIETATSKTESPWIFFEILVSKFIQQKEPSRLKTKFMNESEKMQFTLDFAHLPKLSGNDLLRWEQQVPQASLDWLYKTFKDKSQMLTG